jgi:hypothetical protein
LVNNRSFSPDVVAKRQHGWIVAHAIDAEA